MISSARCYADLLNYIQDIPLIDCHDHAGECGPTSKDPIQALMDGYFYSDMLSASSDADMAIIEDKERPLAERWQIFERAWKRTCHTGYAQGVRRVLKEFYGETTLTLPALERIRSRIVDIGDEKVYVQVLEKAHIVARLEDIWPNLRKVMDGTLKLTPRGRLVVSLPGFHALRCASNILDIGNVLNRTVTSLDEYIDVCWTIFQGYKKFGAVAFKDQSAYERTLAYANPTRHQAEEVFNWMMADPRRRAAYPDQVKPLSDFLFHQFMRMARDLDLPVQIHTGHMAGIRNEITKTNAILLTSVLEMHRDTRFDLFHANWPYSGELLFLAKNYPNVAIDFCWANIIDPIYCQNLFKQIISSVPHGKVHGYGSDFGGDFVTHAWAHASIARENIAIALADLVECQYLDLDEAKEVAYAWLFGNANEFFKLGL
jgi:hypothetical protein